MKNKDEKKQGCSCAADREKAVDQMVKEGTAPTGTEHNRKKEEVEAAFPEQTTQK